MRSQVGGANSYRKHIRAFIMSCWGAGHISICKIALAA